MRRPAAKTAALVVFLLAWGACFAVARPPNIVLIMADDLGYAHLGCYGQTKIRTPHLDRLAAEGLRFTSAYAGCCVCALSRSVLMTGLHGGHTPVRGNTGGVPLADDDVTVAEVLKSAGYVTGLFGKWGLGEHGTEGVPNRQGFDEFFGYLHQIHAHFYYPEYLWLNDEHFPLAGNQNGQRRQYTHDEIVSRAMAFVRRHRDEPFFLYVPFAVPHYELLVPEDSLAEYAGKFPETPYRGRGGQAGYPYDYAAQSQPRAATAAMITRMDRSVGKLSALLDELELTDDTIVFFTSDNGAAKGPSDPKFFAACGPLRGTKGTLYEGGIRVPMIVRWPKHIAAGATSDLPWYFADVLPTLAELAGATPPSAIDGISVVPTLLGERAAAHTQTPRKFLYWEDDDGLRAVRQGKWKAIRDDPTNEHVALYDLEADLGETTDVSAQHPQVTARLTTILQSAHLPQRPQIEPPPPPDRQFQ